MDYAIYWFAAVALIGVGLYVLRDRFRGRPVPDALKPGRPLPEFEAVDESGNSVRSADLAGTPAVLLFVRGSWCPFCSKQVASLTRVYKEITDAGARLILVTPQPLQTTRRVAEMFELDFNFWLDESLAAARQLGLLMSDGVPDDYRQEYGEDTLWPTSLVVDAGGVIRYTALSRFIADRPDPEQLLKVVRQL